MTRTNNTEATKASRSTEASKTAMTPVGKMFVYIALCELLCNWAQDGDLSDGVINALIKPLMREFVIRRNAGDMFELTSRGWRLVPRYVAACADELKRGQFGKLKWDTRSEYHEDILALIP